MASNQHKRGDTFDISGPVALTINEVAQLNLTGWTGTCQIRRSNGALIAELVFVWLDVTQSLCRISATNTGAWPIGPARFDIQLTDGSAVVSTATQLIEIVEDVTHA